MPDDPRPRPVVFDTDGGVDDCLALWWGLTSGGVDVVAVSTVAGNVSVEQATKNVAKVLDAAGRRDIPIAVGADAPLAPGPIEPSARHVHGDDGLGGTGPPDVDLDPVAEPAPQLLARLASERPGELTLVAVGPLTNVALALRDAPVLTTQLRDLAVMGGAVHTAGNVTPLAEFNIACDPVAAAETVAADWVRPPLLVPLDVTYVATLGAAELDLLRARRSPAARFLAGAIEHYHGRTAHRASDAGCPAHDLLALVAVADPTVVSTTTLPLQIDTGQHAAWGAVVADARPGVTERIGNPWRVALDVDVERFRTVVRDLFA